MIGKDLVADKHSFFEIINGMNYLQCVVWGGSTSLAWSNSV